MSDEVREIFARVVSLFLDERARDEERRASLIATYGPEVDLGPSFQERFEVASNSPQFEEVLQDLLAAHPEELEIEVLIVAWIRYDRLVHEAVGRRRNSAS